MWAATMKKLPTVIHEQNSYAGITNKILRNRVDTICVAYDRMERFFPQRKIVKVGNPIRQDLMNVNEKRQQAYAFFQLDPGKKTILIIGGSLGARTINESILGGLEELKQQGVQLIWQTGKTFYSKAQLTADAQVKVYEFIYEMDMAYAAADIVISRAGALSIAELALVQKPVILVPSPNVAEDHQTKNAMALVERQAALLVKDAESRKNLIPAAIALIQDEIRQTALKQNIGSFAMPNAARRIVDELLRVIEK
jgi:UDP-N-acetylglucosamine--N-acetylmuramyl-(pentapeptide) pyrophosphoryl-undecaprenol N-acetylglucosamine transferase